MVKRLLVVAVVLFTGLALKSVSAQSKPAQYVTSADAVKFTPLDPKDPNGAAVSVVTGELQGKGPITLLLRPWRVREPSRTGSDPRRREVRVRPTRTTRLTIRIAALRSRRPL